MNKKEIKRTAVRRRGTTIAAAALSIAMVGPFVHAVTPVSSFAAVANAQETQPAADAPAATGADKAIYSPGQADQKGTISGSVKEIVEAAVGFGNVQGSGNPLAGVKVYAQWYEGAQTQHSSPIYYTESDANGNFSINMAPYTDALGVNRKFEADASVGETVPQRDHKREKIRVWTELPDDMTDKYRLVHQPAAGIFPAIGDAATPTEQGDGAWGGNKVTGMTIQYAQKDKLPQHLPENQWVESTGTGGNDGTYAGRAFWNMHVLLGALNHNTQSAFNSKDLAAPGLKVVGSYLSDEAVTKIEQYAKDNFAGKTLRGKGWTPVDEQGLQKWINEQIAADPQGWIAETMTTTTSADGKFELRWKGLYGNNHTGTGGGINPPADKLHKLAGSHDEGSWANGNRQSKHVNMHWSYVSILDKNGNPLPDNIGALYPWSLGQWAGPGFGADLNAGANAQLFGGDGALIGNTTDGYTGWNIALAPQALKFDVVEKNTTDNWAAIGDKVQTDTAGLPIADNLNYYIEWVDKNGKVVKTCETAKADSATKIPSCALDVPADAETGDTFTARLKVTSGDPDSKNDLVLAVDAFAVTRDYLEYDPVDDAKAEQPATSEPKFDNPATDAEETKPEDPKFELGKLPEGVTEDQVKVDPKTGVVTFKPTAEQVGKTFKFPVVMRDEALQVPVRDENGDPVKDDEGNPKTQGRIVARADAPFKVADATASTIEPKYEDKLVVPGEETKSTPSFTDKDGKDAKAPADSKFKIADGFKAPEGYTVKIDENTGVITVTAPEKLNGETVEEFEVPVTVTYPDGTTDNANAKFELDTDGDGTPDSKDDDDDGDGIPDKDEEEKGSNPKDKGSIPATPLEPGNPTDAATLEPSYEDQLVVPGEETKSTPSFTDKDGKDAKAPADSKFKIADGFKAPEGYTVKIDENTGVITVTAPEKLNGETVEEFEVPVTVTYPDGTTDNANAKFELDTDGDGTPDSKDDDDDNDGVSDKDEKDKGTNPKDPSDKPSEDKAPDWSDNASTTPDEPAVVEKDPNSGDVKPGTTVKVTEGDGTAEIDPETGDITVTPGEDAKPGDKVVVEVKDPSGEVIDTITVTIADPSINTDKVTITEGQETDPFDTAKDVPEGGTVSVDNLPGGLTVDPETGKVTGTPDKLDDWGKDEETRDVVVTVTITDADGNEVSGDKVITIQRDTDGDGDPDVTDPDDDNDGATDEEENKAGTDPKDPNSKPSEDKAPDWNDGSTTPDKPVELPNTGGSVEDGTTVETEGPGEAEIGEDGTITVTPGEDAKPGDKVVVEVKDPSGEVIDTVEVEITKPSEDKAPDWNDGSTTPDKPVELPNTGGSVEDGTTVETEGPGEAEIGEDGTITVTPGEDAKPGDKVVVEVKDPSGEVIDTVEVEITKPSEDKAPDWNDGSTTPDKPVELPNTGGSVEDGTTVETEGPGEAEIGEDGTITVTPGENAKPGDKVVVEVKDPSGKVIDTVEVEITKPGKPGGSSDWDGSSNLSQRCINTGLGVGIPLLFLIPVGLASQMNIPGLKDFVAPINKQIQNLNTQLQKQAGVFNGPLAGKVAGIDAQLKRFGADYQQVAGAVALIAAGALAIGLIADACAPGAGSSNGSSK